MAPATPQHERVSSWIREQIETSALHEHDRLPSENQLGIQFEVSRITVRRALQTLETDGLIYRRQGLGSFVEDKRLRQGLDRLSDFVEDMQAAGVVAQSTLVAEETIPASARVAAALGLEEGTSVHRIDRLRLGDSEVLAFDQTWLPMFYSHLLEKHDLEKDTIYGILERDYDIRVCKGLFRIEAINAPNDVAQHLDVPWGRALLLIERTSRTVADKAICFQKRYYRCDRVAYELELRRGRGLPGGGVAALTEFEPIFKQAK